MTAEQLRAPDGLRPQGTPDVNSVTEHEVEDVLTRPIKVQLLLNEGEGESAQRAHRGNAAHSSVSAVGSVPHAAKGGGGAAVPLNR